LPPAVIHSGIATVLCGLRLKSKRDLGCHKLGNVGNLWAQ